MKLPAKGTILAPASLHLPLYDLLYRQHGNTAGLQVLSLEAYASQLASREGPDLLLQAHRLLSAIPEDNVFAASLQDAQFLQACIGLRRKALLFGLETYPETTTKEKDLKAVLEALAPLPLVQESQKAFVKQDQRDVWILPVRQEENRLELERQLLEHGARKLESGQPQTRTFYACANIRKCLEAAAGDIVARSLDAGKVLVALADPSWQWVLEQVFQARKIPYTLLHPRSESTVGKEFGAILRYLQDKNPETWTHLVKTLYPASCQDVLDCLALFGPDSQLNEMEYEENTLVSPLQFARWQLQEQRAREWMERHRYMESWDLSNLETIALAVQKRHPEPTEEDLTVFDQAIQLIMAAAPDQLPLLIQAVESLQAPPHPDTLTGALVGTLNDISPLHEEVYLIGPHAGLFPGLKTWSGIFDESYARHAEFPLLPQRLQAQRDNLYHTLSQPARLHVYLPQSDYMGRSLESSFELEQFMGGKPQFVPVKDPSVWRSPDFKAPVFPLESQPTANMLRLHQRCPLRVHLRHSLQLKPEYEPELKMNQNTVQVLLKKLDALPDPDPEALLRQEYAFARKLFPQRQAQFEAQILQESRILQDLLERLQLYRNQMHLDWLNEEYQAQSEKWQGSLQAWNRNAIPLVLQEEGQTRAAAQVPLHVSPEEYPWFSVSYRSKNPVLRQESLQDRARSVQQALCEDAVWAQELENPAGKLQKKPGFAQKLEQMQESLEAFLQSREDIQPIHEDGACQHCPYGRICRNASRKKGEN